jgi:tetratricopeptide (TPR) repeat protein
MATEWYRRRDWTPAVRDEFFARLRGSRSKAQHLRIQAAELKAVGSRPCLEGALELVEVLTCEFPHAFELAVALQIRAECLESLGQVDAAIDSYRQSLQAQRQFRNVQTTAHLRFAWLVATMPRPQLYDEALKVLGEFDRHEILPIAQYRFAGAYALMLAASGDVSEAQRWAERALEAAGSTTSGLRYHPGLGLVTNPDTETHARLLRLAVSRRN